MLLHLKLYQYNIPWSYECNITGQIKKKSFCTLNATFQPYPSDTWAESLSRWMPVCHLGSKKVIWSNQRKKLLNTFETISLTQLPEFGTGRMLSFFFWDHKFNPITRVWHWKNALLWQWWCSLGAKNDGNQECCGIFFPNTKIVKFFVNPI